MKNQIPQLCVVAVLVIVLLLACNKDDEKNSPPTAAFTISPDTSSTIEMVVFNASSSHDDEDPSSVLQVRWNWEDDGIWDTDWSADKDVEHKFGKEGTHKITLEVRDPEGLSNVTTNNFLVSNNYGPDIPCPGIPAFNYNGRKYKTVQIGDQCWMQSNLNWEVGDSWCYDNDPANCETYGRLYNWETIMNGSQSSVSIPSGVQGICPVGWHIPSDGEWEVLMDQIGDNNYAGEEMKSLGTLQDSTGIWNISSSVHNIGTNESGFTALPSGYYSPNNTGGDFIGIHHNTYYFSSTEDDESTFWSRLLASNSQGVSPKRIGKVGGFSLRCIKD